MSWVLMMVVMLNSCVMLCSRSSITSDVLGSSPELGSSQNRYLGFRAIARAMATRFCIPPDISPGYFSSAPTRLTRSRQSIARFWRSRRFIVENMSRGNMTFSSTVSESKSAADWNIMPISRRMCIFSCFDIFTKSRPSYRIWPAVGSNSPTRFFISTVFPLPLWPMMRFVLPSSKMVEMSLSTSTPSKLLYKFLTSIMTAAVLRIRRRIESVRSRLLQRLSRPYPH